MTTYTIGELVRIQAAAQSVADRANAMGTMLIYTNGDNQTAADGHQNGLQGAFSELHSHMLGPDFEIPQINAQEPTKPKPRDLAVFDSVARIIGVDEAEAQLQAVIDGGLVNMANAGMDVLIDVFPWGFTAQGHNYWSKINKAIKQQEAK